MSTDYKVTGASVGDRCASCGKQFKRGMKAYVKRRKGILGFLFGLFFGSRYCSKTCFKGR